MELILIELLRNEALRIENHTPNILAGLADPVAALALRAMHGDVAHSWTVAELARLAGDTAGNGGSPQPGQIVRVRSRQYVVDETFRLRRIAIRR